MKGNTMSRELRDLMPVTSCIANRRPCVIPKNAPVAMPHRNTLKAESNPPLRSRVVRPNRHIFLCCPIPVEHY